jgi:hypothetical protein
MRWIAVALLFALTIGTALIASNVSRSEESEPEYPHGDFAEDCESCHLPDSWTPAVVSSNFDHSRATRGFALVGQHLQVECRLCHASLDFRDAETECVACHLDVHQSELGTDCAQCHTPRSFIDNASMIRMHLTTRFPLRGTHATVDCQDCHELSGAGSLQYVSTPTECEACHIEQFLSTTDPDHQAFGFSQDCQACHASQAWIPAAFDHSEIPVGENCASCHIDDYTATSDPDHEAFGIPQTCEDCHSTNSWIPATFDHALLPPGAQCTTCHLNDFTSTTDPDHQAAALPQDCELCHTTRAWVPADFDHNLLGPGSQCVTCHLEDFDEPWPTQWHPSHPEDAGDG